MLRAGQVGVYSGVTTLVDTGSVGVTNIGVFGTHIQPRSKTRVLCYVNVGSFALTTARAADVLSLDEVERDWIARCIAASPGLISGVKLRVTGPFVLEHGEELIALSKSIAAEHQLPFMAHIGNRRAEREQGEQLTRFLLEQQTQATSSRTCARRTRAASSTRTASRWPNSSRRGARGVVMDSALGRHNFSFKVARAQADLGIQPDTISTDITPGGYGEIVFSLLECMAKFMALGYSLADVVRMTTVNPARALGLADQIGAIAVGRVADLSIIDVVPGRWRFTDTVEDECFGEYALVPVHTLRGGEMIAPNWGPHRRAGCPEAG